MTEHKPFSVAVTVRAACTDIDQLRAAVSMSTKLDAADLAALDAAGLLAELIGTGSLPGIDVIEIEPSYSGEFDVGLVGDD